MTQRNRIFLGQLTERKGPYGTFYSGRIGAAQMVVSPAKEPGKVNVYLEESLKPEQDAKPKQSGFEDRMADDGLEPIPF